jgi:phenylalanyl-tRNA synthetase beta chain
MEEYAGGTSDDAYGAALFAPWAGSQIVLPVGFVQGLIGVNYPTSEVIGALRLIGCDVDDRGDELVVSPPSWRPDLTDKWTLAEEVARIEGYDRIPSLLPTPPSGRGLTTAQQGRRRVGNALAAAGYVETPSFPFTTTDQNDLHGSASGGHLPSVKLANPLDGQAPFLRRSLVPALLRVAHRNVARGFTDLQIFETGAVFLPEPGVTYGTPFVPPLAVRPDAATLTALDASIPPQHRHVAVLLAGSITPKQPGTTAEAAGLADALDAARTIASAAGVSLDVSQGERAALHPGRTAVLSVGATAVGYAGELLPAVAEAADLPGRVIVAELDLDLILSLAGEKVVAESLSGYPAATQDLSLVVGADVPAAAVRAVVADGAGALLESMRLVDDYRGAGVPEGAKSLTFALRFRAPDRTLTAAEATEAKLAGVAVAAERFGATLRE